MQKIKPVSFERVFEYFDTQDPYDEVFSNYLENDKTNVSEYISMLGIKDKEKIEDAIRSFSKDEIEYILYHAKNILEGVLEDTLIDLIRLRYRRYMFRAL